MDIVISINEVNGKVSTEINTAGKPTSKIEAGIVNYVGNSIITLLDEMHNGANALDEETQDA